MFFLKPPPLEFSNNIGLLDLPLYTGSITKLVGSIGTGKSYCINYLDRYGAVGWNVITLKNIPKEVKSISEIWPIAKYLYKNFQENLDDKNTCIFFTDETPWIEAITKKYTSKKISISLKHPLYNRKTAKKLGFSTVSFKNTLYSIEEIEKDEDLTIIFDIFYLNDQSDLRHKLIEIKSSIPKKYLKKLVISANLYDKPCSSFILRNNIGLEYFNLNITLDHALNLLLDTNITNEIRSYFETLHEHLRHFSLTNLLLSTKLNTLSRETLQYLEICAWLHPSIAHTCFIADNLDLIDNKKTFELILSRVQDFLCKSKNSCILTLTQDIKIKGPSVFLTPKSYNSRNEVNQEYQPPLASNSVNLKQKLLSQLLGVHSKLLKLYLQMPQSVAFDLILEEDLLNHSDIKLCDLSWSDLLKTRIADLACLPLLRGTDRSKLRKLIAVGFGDLPLGFSMKKLSRTEGAVIAEALGLVT